MFGGRWSGPVPEWRQAARGRGTPAADADVVYFLSREHQVVAIARADGRVRWSASTGGLEASTMGTRVVLAGGVVVAGDSDVIAFDRETGRRRWTSAVSGAEGVGPFLGAASGGVIYTGSAAGRLYAFRAGDGAMLWGYLVGSGMTVFAPILAGGLVVASFTHFGERQTGGVVAVDRRTGQERWRRPFPSWNAAVTATGAAGEPIVVDEWVVASSQEGVIYAIGRDTGEVAWVIAEPARRADGHSNGGQDFRPLAHAGPLLVAGSLSGEIAAYDVATRRLRWRTAPVPASVAFGLAADSVLAYVPLLSGHLLVVEVRTGRERWRLGGGTDGFTWTPLVTDSAVYVAGSESGFLAFRRRAFR